MDVHPPQNEAIGYAPWPCQAGSVKGGTGTWYESAYEPIRRTLLMMSPSASHFEGSDNRLHGRPGWLAPLCREYAHILLKQNNL